jgi:hypothetical protein
VSACRLDEFCIPSTGPLIGDDDVNECMMVWGLISEVYEGAKSMGIEREGDIDDGEGDSRDGDDDDEELEFEFELELELEL